MTETEEEERDAKHNANNVTMYAFSNQFPVTTNTQGEIAKVTNERRIPYDILAGKIKGFNGLTIQSTFNNSIYYGSEEYDAESDPNSDPKVSTHITNGNSPHKLLINRLIPEIIPAAIPPIY